MIAIQAHYDGKKVCLDEPITIKQNTPLVVVVLEKEEDENQQGYQLAMQGLERAYDADEPDYTNVPLKETNLLYKPLKKEA